MTGLRARQKADRSKRILEAATTLFRAVGYDSARIEDMAEIAGVSVGTFYNYYENKGDILVAVVSMEVEEVLGDGVTLIDNPPDNIADAITKLIGQYYDHSLYYLSKDMWRAAMALSIQQPDTPFSRRYTELDRRLCTQVGALVRRLQEKGLVEPSIDSAAVGDMIFNNLNMMFIEFVKDEAMTVEELKFRVERQNRPLTLLMARRKPIDDR